MVSLSRYVAPKLAPVQAHHMSSVGHPQSVLEQYSAHQARAGSCHQDPMRCLPAWPLECISTPCFSSSACAALPQVDCMYGVAI